MPGRYGDPDWLFLVVAVDPDMEVQFFVTWTECAFCHANIAHGCDGDVRLVVQPQKGACIRLVIKKESDLLVTVEDGNALCAKCLACL